MKKFILLFFFWVIAFSSYAQSWVWGREPIPNPSGFGDPQGDHCVAADKLGNSYITGYFNGDISFGSYNLNASGNGNGDVYVAKYDKAGNVLWAKQSISPTNLSGGNAYSIGVDLFGNIYVAGEFGDTISFGSYTLMNPFPGFGGIFIVKYDANGNTLWAKQAVVANKLSHGAALSLAVDGLGNICMTGLFQDSISFGAYTLHTTPPWDAFLVKYDANGNVLWAKQSVLVNANSQSIGYSVATDASNNIYITGQFSDTVTFGPYSLVYQQNNGGEVFLVKYDANGNVIWARQSSAPGSSSAGQPTSIAIDGSGNSYITGSFISSLAFDTTILNNVSSYGSFLVKYNSAGNVLWANQIYEQDGNAWLGYSVATDTLATGGCYYLSAGSSSPPYRVKFGNKTFSLATTYQSATVLIKVDSSGNPLCGTIFSEGDEDDGDAVNVDRSGQYAYITGDLKNPSSFGKDTLVYGGDMTFLARWEPCDIIIDTTPVTKPTEPCSNLFVPNAFSPNNDGQNDILLVQGNCLKTMDFIIFDRWGNKVFESENIYNGWDGTYNNQPMNTGTYAYYLKATMQDGSNVEKHGNITLVR
ncbi:MAG TPA: gliding motility-associated C-terminal domain-containing protein [Bacteroidia bacterium]|nr:gliding motility-associated C-terminal domain-containing protein [Bacteroidia bacterium]